MTFLVLLASFLPLHLDCESEEQGPSQVYIASLAPALRGPQEAGIKRITEGLNEHFAWLWHQQNVSPPGQAWVLGSGVLVSIPSSAGFYF